MTNINIRVNEETKKQAEIVFEELGMSLSAAINIFLKQSIRENGIPFAVKINEPNEATMSAMKEAEGLKNSKGYKNVKDLRRALDV